MTSPSSAALCPSSAALCPSSAALCPSAAALCPSAAALCPCVPGCCFVNFNRWSEGEAAIEALNGQYQFPAASAKVVVKFADAKPGAAGRQGQGEKRPPGNDMGQVESRLLPLPCQLPSSCCSEVPKNLH
jgi:hypothetical protein